MFASLVEATGLWFVIACAFHVVVVFVEQLGAARTPEDDERRGGFGVIVMFFAALLAPGLLMMHGFFVTRVEAHQALGLLPFGLPIAASVVGGLFGAIVGAVLRGAAPTIRMVAPWFAAAGLILAIYATLPSIMALIGAIQNGGVMILSNTL